MFRLAGPIWCVGRQLDRVHQKYWRKFKINISIGGDLKLQLYKDYQKYWRKHYREG